MYLDALDHLCLMMLWHLYAIPTSNPSLATGWFWGAILRAVHISSDLKRRRLELLWDQDQGIPIENCLSTWGSSHYSPTTLSLLIFVVNNKNHFYVNSEIHSINTRQNSNLHQPQANLTLYHKGAYYSGIEVFNNLPTKEIYFVMLKDLNRN